MKFRGDHLEYKCFIHSSEIRLLGIIDVDARAKTLYGLSQSLDPMSNLSDFLWITLSQNGAEFIT